MWFSLSVFLMMGPTVGQLSSQEVQLSGKAIKLTELLATRGISADAAPIADQVVLSRDDGSIVPLLSDPASRALFLDQRLRNRPLRLTGRDWPGLPFVQVITFQIEEQGRFRTPEYYCDVCSIRVRYPQICPCCQGPVVLRMAPEEEP